MNSFRFSVLLLLLLAIGCCNAPNTNLPELHERTAQGPRPVVHTPPPAEKEVVRYVGGSCEHLIKVVPTAPAEAVSGQTYESSVTITAVNNAGHVTLMTVVPPEASYVKSEPPAAANGNELTWRLGTMMKGQSTTVKMWLTGREGNVTLCYAWDAKCMNCVSTKLGRPILAISKSGPATAELGANITYSIVVRNTGTAAARNVTVIDAVPQGLSHSSGSNSICLQERKNHSR